jgi:hypothetical protein
LLAAGGGGGGGLKFMAPLQPNNPSETRHKKTTADRAPRIERPPV